MSIWNHLGIATFASFIQQNKQFLCPQTAFVRSISMLGLTSGLHANPTLLNGYWTCWSIVNDSESNRLHMRIFVRYETFYDRFDQVFCINQTIQIMGTKSLTFLSYHSHCCALCNSNITFDWKLHGVCGAVWTEKS